MSGTSSDAELDDTENELRLLDESVEMHPAISPEQRHPLERDRGEDYDVIDNDVTSGAASLEECSEDELKHTTTSTGDESTATESRADTNSCDDETNATDIAVNTGRSDMQEDLEPDTVRVKATSARLLVKQQEALMSRLHNLRRDMDKFDLAISRESSKYINGSATGVCSYNVNDSGSYGHMKSSYDRSNQPTEYNAYVRNPERISRPTYTTHYLREGRNVTLDTDLDVDIAARIKRRSYWPDNATPHSTSYLKSTYSTSVLDDQLYSSSNYGHYGNYGTNRYTYRSLREKLATQRFYRSPGYGDKFLETNNYRMIVSSSSRI